MKLLTRLSLICFWIVLCSGNNRKLKFIFLTDISVAQENAYRFVQISSNDEELAAPIIRKDLYIPNLIVYSTGNFIHLAPNSYNMAYLGWKDNKVNIMIRSVLGGRAVMQRTFRDNVEQPCFSPDGKYIAFTDWTNGLGNIAQMSATEGSAIQRISNASSSEFSPIYTPNGKEIFFSRAQNNQGRLKYFIWSFNRESSMFTEYGEGMNPDFDSTGNILFVTRNNSKTGFGEIWSVNIMTGSEMLILSSNDVSFSTPKISPNGRKLLCVGVTKATKSIPSNLDLYTVNINGTSLTQLTFHPANDCSAIWSEDGKFIYLLSQRGSDKGKWNIWKMNYNL
jgi:Tol biopolymer transport system component